MTIDFRAAACRSIATTVAVLLLMPGAAHAQGQVFARVHGSVEELYDSNIFAVPETETTQPQSDWITLLGPMFEAGYQSIPMKFQAHYGFNAEKHRTMVDLDKAVARQEAGTTLTYQGRTFSVALNGGYVNTQTPTELNLETMFFVGRSRAERIDSSEAFVVDLSPVTSLKLDHEFRHDSIVGGVTSVGNGARLGVARKMSGRSSVRADYRFGFINFSNGGEERSHVGTFGVVHAFTPMLDVEADAGVRSTSGDIDPEVSALVRQRMQNGSVAVRYAHTRETTIGGGASLDSRRISAEVVYTPTRAIAFTVSPARASSGGTLSRDVVYLVDLQTRIRATRRWSILAVGRVGQQDRTLPTHDVIDYRSVSLKTILTLGTLEREREDAETETP